MKTRAFSALPLAVYCSAGFLTRTTVAVADSGASASLDAATPTPPEPLPDLRFHVPFPVVSVQGLDLEPQTASSQPDLRVKRTLAGDATSAACDAGGNGDGAIAAFPSVRASDRVVAVDGIPISLQSFHEVIDLPVGTTVVLPLFKASVGKGDGNILTGFARVEIMRPQTVEFQPTTSARVADVRQWQAAVAHQEQRQLEREQEEKERAAAVENDKVEREAREKRAREEQYRLEMTPHERVALKRGDGREFRYAVEFTTKGPIGLNWDLLTQDKTVVSHLEPKLAAQLTGVIAPKDQLIQLNDVDTWNMAPHDVVQVYVQATPPRRMVFRCAASAAVVAKEGAAATVEATQNWTIAFESPPILSGWQVRLHLATWSEEPRALRNETLTLVATSPITGCSPAPPSVAANAAFVAYRGVCSFVEKAQMARAGKMLVVVNNLKGDGRFPAKMPDVPPVDIAVTMMGKLEGELTLAVLEHDPDVRFRVYEEDVSLWQSLLSPRLPRRLTNEEMVLRRDPKRAARSLTFWHINTTAKGAPRQAETEMRVLPALFGGNITAAPFRIVMAYPQDTACHPQGLGVLATRSVILVKRGGCSFGTKAKSVQTVGGAGMLLINSDETLLPLMSDPKEVADLTIWAASVSLSDGSLIQNVLARNQNLPSLVKIATEPIAAASG